MKSLPKFVLLDRDGVINHDSDDYIKAPEEWIPVPGSLEAIAELSKNGYGIVVITNQSGLARGLYDRDTLDAIHRKMRNSVSDAGGRIEAIYFCPHGPDSDCDCRKPKPGLLRRFAEEYQTSLQGVPFIGDSYRDVQAGTAAGAEPFLVKTGNGQATLARHPDLGIPVFEDLYDASRFILSGW